MKRTQEVRHEVNVCPQCQATCMVGHDEDGLILCAKCGCSFRADDIVEISTEQLHELFTNATKYERSGWMAFEKK